MKQNYQNYNKMKKLFFICMGLIGFVATAQPTMVDTMPQKRGVLIEEFTGINCVNCPAGATKLNEIRSMRHSDRISAVAIHAGQKSIPSAGQPNYRTPIGDSLAVHFNNGFSPSGVIDREAYPFNHGNVFETETSGWTKASKTKAAQGTPVNIAAKATINTGTRAVELDIEAYYTENDDNSTNYLTVYVVQDRIVGFQDGGSGSYEHNHMLREALTPTWGEPITTTTKRSFFSKNYSFTLPADYYGIPVVPENIYFIVAINRTKDTTLNAITVHPKYNGTITRANALSAVRHEVPICLRLKYLDIIVENTGNNPIGKITAGSNINGTSENLTWNAGPNDTIMPGHFKKIRLKFNNANISSGSLNWSVTFNTINDQTNQEPRNTKTVSGSNTLGALSTSGAASYSVSLDEFGSDNHLYVIDSNLNVVYERCAFPTLDATYIGGVYPGRTATGTFYLPPGTYQLYLDDDWGDGIASTGSGRFTLKGIGNLDVPGYGFRRAIVVNSNTACPTGGCLPDTACADTCNKCKGDPFCWNPCKNCNDCDPCDPACTNPCTTCPCNDCDPCDPTCTNPCTICTDTTDMKFSKNINDAIELYPNPASDIIKATFKDNLNVKDIEILDPSGKILITINAAGKKYVEIDIKTFTAGVYLFSANTDKGIVVQKILKK